MLTQKRTIASDGAEMFALKILLYGAGFGASVLISRRLGVEGRGIYYLPILGAATLTTFGVLGLEQANVFFFGTRRVPIARLWAQAGLVALFMGLVGAACLIAAPGVLPAVFSHTPAMLLWLAGLSIPFALHSQLAAGLLTLRGEVTWQFRVGLVVGLIQVAMLGALFFTPGYGVTAVVAVHLVCALLTWVSMTWKLRDVTPRIGCDWTLLRESLTHSLVLHLGMVFLFLHLRLDMLMVHGIAGVAALGAYSLSVTLAETVMLVTDSVALAILPRQVTNSLEEAAVMALRGVRLNVLLGVTLATCWAVVGYPLIFFAFGRDFGSAYVPLAALLPGMVFLGVQRVCGGPVLRTGTPGRIVAINGLSLVCNAGLNFWWIPIWGPAGAGLASSISYGFGCILFLTWTTTLARSPFWVAVIPGGREFRTLWLAAGTMVTARARRVGE